jgi:radical SAM superfamily enzyme YgiQ (UPF0313 family)
MKITFIYPAVGKKPGGKYIRTWTMEPLTIATLKALTPEDFEVEFFDDRVELINYDAKTDGVAITVETYTAKRAYQIAVEFHKRGVPVIMGGYHPTLLPEEAEQVADAVVIGNAEAVWPQVLHDLRTQTLRKRYVGQTTYATLPDRTIWQGKTYLPISLVETGRGCPFRCEFCAISSYYCARYFPRPIADVVADVERAGKKYVFFVDDNLAANPQYTIQLCKELTPLNIVWTSQATLNVAQNKELLHWLAKSGCRVLLIGFESFEAQNLKQMQKDWMGTLGDRDELVQRIHDVGISIYATFVFGFDYDTPASFEQALEFSQKHGFFFAAFNHLLPFPGTRLYERLRQEKRLLTEKWWLEPGYQYGQIMFQPQNMMPEELSARCADARRRFFRWSSMLKRGALLFRRHPPLRLFAAYWLQNLTLKHEVDGRLGLPIGEGLDEWPK